jgi:hypothetical protein
MRLYFMALGAVARFRSSGKRVTSLRRANLRCVAV